MSNDEQLLPEEQEVLEMKEADRATVEDAFPTSVNGQVTD